MSSEQQVLAPIELHETPTAIGRYLLHRQIARGGMASIHIGRLVGDQGFDRIVALKRLHPEFAEDAEFVAMFLNEARVASKVKHRNVVPVLDVVTAGEEVLLVQEYVHGAPLHVVQKAMQQAGAEMPLEIAVAIGCQVLAGLHAAHETVDEMGMPLEIVHRDVSPQNVLIATDGSARLLDFGVAKAAVAAHVTREGTYKGKLAYSAPEQIRGAATRQSDVYSLSVVLWEMIVGHRMHRAGKGSTELIEAVLLGALPTIREALSVRATGAPFDEERARQVEDLERVVLRGLALDTNVRWANAAVMEEALRGVVQPAPAGAVASFLRSTAREFIERRERLIAAEESSWRKQKPTFDVRGSSSSPPPQDSSIRMRLWPDSTTESIAELSAAKAEGEGADAYASMAVLPPKTRWGFFALGLSVLALALGLALGAHTNPSREAPAASGPAPKVARSISPPPSLPTPPSAPPESARAAVEQPDDEPAPAHRRGAERESSSRARGEPRQSRARASSSPASSSPQVPAAEAQSAPPTPSSRPSDDCATPYYFEGAKKLFKPACL